MIITIFIVRGRIYGLMCVAQKKRILFGTDFLMNLTASCNALSVFVILIRYLFGEYKNKLAIFSCFATRNRFRCMCFFFRCQICKAREKEKRAANKLYVIWKFVGEIFFSSCDHNRFMEYGCTSRTKKKSDEKWRRNKTGPIPDFLSCSA